jgi:hypothetical protein
MLSKVIFNLLTGMAIILAIPVFSQQQNKEFKVFKLIGNTATQFEYTGVEPLLYFNDSFSFVLNYCEVKNSAILYTYKGFKPNEVNLIKKDTLQLNNNKHGSLQGFFVTNKNIVLLFHSQLVVFNCKNKTCQIVKAIDSDYDHVLISKDGYFVLCRYYNYKEIERKDIALVAYQLTKDTLIKKWEYKREYKEIYYTHLTGNYLDINSNGDLVLGFPSENKLLLFNKVGIYKSINMPIDNFPDTALLNINMSIMNNASISLKQQIENLILLDTLSNRIQNIRFINDKTLMVVRKSKELNRDFRYVDLWLSDSLGGIFCVQSNLLYRNEFEHATDNEEFYINPCLSCSNKLYFNESYVYFMDVFIPKKYLKYSSFPKIKKSLASYYSNKKLRYGLFKFKINLQQ